MRFALPVSEAENEKTFSICKYVHHGKDYCLSHFLNLTFCWNELDCLYRNLFPTTAGFRPGRIKITERKMDPPNSHVSPKSQSLSVSADRSAQFLSRPNTTTQNASTGEEDP
jgi:hypothetical protein